MFRLALVLALSIAALGAWACDDDSNGDGNGADDPSTLSDGESLGSIQRFPGGTQVPTDARTFVEATCADDRLVVVTDRETVSATMPCDRMLPPDVLARFPDQPVVISYSDGRLIIESPQIGTMTFPAEDPRIETGDDSP